MARLTLFRSFSFRSQLALAFLAFSVIGANDGAIGVLIPGISTHYGVNKAIVSLLFLCSSAGYLIAAFNSGFLVKTLGERRFLLCGTSAIIVSALAISMVPPFVLLTLPFFLAGFGVASLDTGLNAYVAGLPRSATHLNYLHAFYGAGALLGPIIASTIIFVVGLTWNYVYVLWIILSLFFFFGVLWTFKQQDRVSVSQPEDETPGKTSRMGNVLRLPVAWLLAFFLFFYVGTEVSLGNWSYSFLTEERQLSPLFSAWTVSGYWTGLTLGRIVLAKLVSWLSERAAIQICVIGAMLGILLTWLIPIGIISAIGLCLTGFCLGPLFPTSIAIMPQLFAKRLLATAIGLVVSLACVGGTLFPWLSGNLAQAFGLWIILPLALALTVMMLTLWLLLQLQQNIRQTSI
jgi:fucose permease